MDTKEVLIDDYNYDLPQERIAKYPLAKRDESKLLIYKNPDIQQDVFKNIAGYLDSSYLLIRNNTKVFQARLLFKKETGAEIEIFCLDPLDPSDYALSFQSRNYCIWNCLIGNQKRWKGQNLTKSFDFEGKTYSLTATKISEDSGINAIKFSWDNSEITFADVMEACGLIPLPPYLHRDAEDSDKVRYQTIYSKFEGSVAAPTAGLHFTPEVLDSLKAKNIDTAELTLHVGAGTFKPVKTECIGEHEMHTEHFFVRKAELKKIIDNAQNIVAVGTTTVRTLESLYWLGVKLLTRQDEFEENYHLSQWEVYDMPQDISPKESLNALYNYLLDNNLELLHASTQIIIAPGYHYKLLKALITNFHQPKSTLLLLIAALIGDKWKEVYHFAMENNFRFLSYGDSSLLFNRNL